MEQKIHASDCAVHNAPALPVGLCDCGAKQDERTPERVWADITDDEIEPGQTRVCIMSEDGSLCDMTCPADVAERYAAFIVQACNAYTSTEALREALMLAEKADRIHSKCQECEDGAQAPEVCEHCFPSADDARVARRNVLKALGVKMRDVDRKRATACDCSQEDVHDYGPCDENCRALSGSPAPSTEALRARIRELETAAQQAASIIDRNLYHQREKVEDASAILKDALSATECPSPTHERDGTGQGSVVLDQLADANAPGRSSGSPAPSPWTSEMKRAAMADARKVCEFAETLREIEKQCIQADDPEHHTLGLVKHIARNALNTVAPPISGSPAPSTEGLRMQKLDDLPDAADFLSEIKAHPGAWCFMYEGEDGNSWTRGSLAPDQAAAFIERAVANSTEGLTTPFDDRRFVVINGPEAGCVSIVTGVDALVDEVKSILWAGDEPPEDVLRILDVVADPDADEWHEHDNSPPHLMHQFEDGWIAIWIVTEGKARTALAGVTAPASEVPK